MHGEPKPSIIIPEPPQTRANASGPAYDQHPIPEHYPKRAPGIPFRLASVFPHPRALVIQYVAQAATQTPARTTTDASIFAAATIPSNLHLVFTAEDMITHLERQRLAAQAIERMTAAISEATHTLARSSKHTPTSNEDRNIQLASTISTALENYQVTADVIYRDLDEGKVDGIKLSCPENIALLELIQKMLRDEHGIQTALNQDNDLLLPQTSENKTGSKNINFLNHIFSGTPLALDALKRSEASPFLDTFLDKLEGRVCFSAAGARAKEAAR